VLVEAIRRLYGHLAEPVDASWPVFAVLIVSIVIDLVRYRSLRKIAADTKSDALAADALHFSSDMVASICVLLGLVATNYGFKQGDTIAAIGVAVFIAVAGWRLGRQTIDTLVDRAPRGLAARLREKVETIAGVVSVESVRLRPAGPVVMGEIAIGVPRTMPLERVAIIKENVAKALLAEEPDTNITVTANPVALDNESVLEQVLLIAARRRVPVHHVTVQDIDGIKSVSFDVELDGAMSHGRAHEIASGLEDAIGAELGGGVEVDSHIEPLEVRELRGQDVGADRAMAFAGALSELARIGGVLQDVHDVRARDTQQGLVVNYHCRVDPSLSVNAVHEAVDQIDHGMRERFSNIARVVGHAEPPGH
jgi:divalent metal cation (Fe/Co/Zn/Cd) transporter